MNMNALEYEFEEQPGLSGQPQYREEYRIRQWSEQDHRVLVEEVRTAGEVTNRLKSKRTRRPIRNVTQLAFASVTTAALFAFLASPSSAARARSAMANPDFTQGDKIPEGANHDWTLGATGARGWMFSDKLVTTDSRQIAITDVERDSPADGILAVGDVILGVGGKSFSYDPRTELGKALTTAESEAGGGIAGNHDLEAYLAHGTTA